MNTSCDQDLGIHLVQHFHHYDVLSAVSCDNMPYSPLHSTHRVMCVMESGTVREKQLFPAAFPDTTNKFQSLHSILLLPCTDRLLMGSKGKGGSLD